MFQCPVCGELVEILTNYHCNAKHGMSKKEVVDQFGPPRYVTSAMNREVQNWIRESAVITRVDFEVAQAAIRSQIRRN